jgi:hypothetical protein
VPEVVAFANGSDSVEIPADWWCPVHQRHLTYFEWKRGGCSWCDPSRLPTISRDAKGKPVSDSWKHRDKVAQRVRLLTPEQRAGTQRIEPRAFKAAEIA